MFGIKFNTAASRQREDNALAETLSLRAVDHAQAGRTTAARILFDRAVNLTDDADLINAIAEYERTI
jgi:hypothetical protein